ncbi:MAG: ATP-binding protein [Oscillospiraceae bacterium]|nr:ATP-binding protein [Oscillospiraceae bacterium]
MVKLIMGLKGSGKTKQMIELVKQAVEEEHGDVVCLEKGPKLTYDIPHKARLISVAQYNFGSFEFLKGFISGLNASNYDVSHVFLDSLQKIVDTENSVQLEEFLAWLERFSEKESIRFTITYSAEPELAGEGVRKFL